MKDNEISMDQSKAYVQEHWTDQDLLADGFRSYRPIKHLMMMRMLPPQGAPEIMEDPEVLPPTRARYWMAYSMGSAVKSTDDYDSQPIEAGIFSETFSRWDEPDWKPTSTEMHLERLGCMPYYRSASVWAKQLTVETLVRGKKHGRSLSAPAGAWLCVGASGESWSETDEWFQSHFFLPENSTIDGS